MYSNKSCLKALRCSIIKNIPFRTNRVFFNRNSLHTRLKLPLGMELQEKEKDKKHIGKLFRENPKKKGVY